MASENPLNLVMSEFLPAGAGPDRLDNAFPDLDFEPEKKKFYSNAKETAAYAFVPVFLTMAGGAVDEKLILEESRRFLEISQILAPVVGFLYGYGEQRSWRKVAVKSEKPDSISCVYQGAKWCTVFWLLPNLALNFLSAPNEPSDLWKFWNAGKTAFLPIIYGFAKAPKV